MTSKTYFVTSYEEAARKTDKIKSAYQFESEHEYAFRSRATLHETALMSPEALERYGEASMTIPDLHVWSCEDVDLTGTYALFTEGMALDGSIRKSNTTRRPRFKNSATFLSEDGGYFFTNVSIETVEVDEPAFLLASEGDHMFHHWVFDVLSKLIVWEKHLEKRVKLAVPVTLKSYQKKAYEEIGLTEDSFIYFDPAKKTRFRQLYVSPVFSDAGFVYPAGYEYLRERIFAAYGIDGNTNLADVDTFISRQDVPDHARLLLNERDLIADYVSKGFRELSGGDLSFKEQVRLFARTRNCIMVHGSAGANVLFGHRDMKIIHLHPNCVATFRNHGRVNLILGHDTHYVYGVSYMRPVRIHNNPWFVSASRLDEALNPPTPPNPVLQFLRRVKNKLARLTSSV